MMTSVLLEEVQREGHSTSTAADFLRLVRACDRPPLRDARSLVYDDRRVPARPAFTEDFPRVPEVDALVEAFVRGDYARVRAQARPLAVRSADPEVRRAATTLIERTRPDPLAWWLVALCAALLVALSVRFLWFPSHPPPHAREPGPRASSTSTQSSWK